MLLLLGTPILGRYGMCIVRGSGKKGGEGKKGDDIILGMGRTIHDIS